jgi:hypothetical protein
MHIWRRFGRFWTFLVITLREDSEKDLDGLESKGGNKKIPLH